MKWLAGSFFLMVAIAGAGRAAAPAAAPPTPSPATPAPAVDRLSDGHAGKDVDLTRIAHSPAGGSPYLGAAEAAVVVNVFTDFQCPVCKRAADPIKQLAADFPGKVKVVVRNNALATHVRAKPAAIAAVAAAQQGRYWEYYDKLWAKPGARSDQDLERMAVAVGLDLPRWKTDLADPGAAARVQAESDAAVRLGAAGTPALFVNGMRQVGWGSYRDLHDRVAREIAATDPLIQSGTPAKSVAEARIRQGADRNQKRDGEPAPDLDDWVKVLLAP